MTLSIGIQHPSRPIPVSVLDINSNLGFILTTQSVIPNRLLSFYPGINIPIRTPLLNGGLLEKENSFFNTLSSNYYAFALKKYSYSNKVQIVCNNFFNTDDTLISSVSERKIFTFMDITSQTFKNVEIIIEEIDTPYLLNSPADLSNNPRLRMLDAIKQRYPSINISLGIKVIGDNQNYDNVLMALPLFLDKIKSLDWFQFPLHFTELAYYYQPFLVSQQTQFLDKVKEIAHLYNITSLCYIYPWDGDRIGELQNSLCGIWDEEWNVKYDILRNIGN